MSKEHFVDLTAIYKATTFNLGSRYGDLHLVDDEMCSMLNKMIDDPREYGITLGNGNVAPNQTVTLRFDDPRTGVGLLADHFSEILSFPKGHIQEPRFYLLGPNYCSLDTTNPPELVSKYRLILELIKLFSESAAYLDSNRQELIFIHEGKFSIPITYVENDVSNIDESSMSALLSSFADDTHREQKLSILAKSLQSMVASIDLKLRFKHILTNLSDLKKRLDDGYKLFVADFSYEKIVDQLETAKIEELTKIHKALTDIQNQLLGIPAATVIVATQLKETAEFNLAFLTNSAVLFGVWVFSVLCFFLIQNQKQTLNAVTDEIKRKEELIKKDYPSISNVISDTFENLRERARNQEMILLAIQFIIFIGFVISNIAYLCVTKYAILLLSNLF